MNALGSSPCEAAGQQAQIGEKEPGCGAGNGGLEVLGETATAAQPGKGALDDPSSGQELEAFDARWPLDDLDGPRAAVVDGGEQLGAAVDAIGDDVALASLDALAGVDPTRAATFRGRRALAVDDAGRRSDVASQCQAGALD